MTMMTMMLLAASSVRATLKSRIRRRHSHLLTVSFSSSRSSSTTTSSSRSDKRKRLLLSPHKRCNLIFGANTDVGKTIIATGLCRAALEAAARGGGGGADDDNNNNNSTVHYIKPMQCGGSDQTTVEATIQKLLLTLSTDSSTSTAATSLASRFHAHTLFRWETPTSPHVASRLEGLPLSDDELMNKIQSTLTNIIEKEDSSNSSSTTYIETAGGVMSPSSSSPNNQSLRHAMGHPNSSSTTNSSSSSWGWLTQADLYQPLLGYAPVVLVGDGRLGGISATLSSLESLLLRGYDVVAIVLLESHAGFDNAGALREYATRRLPLYSSTGERSVFTSMSLAHQSIVSLPPVPSDVNIPLDDWYTSPRVVETFAKLDEFLQQSWQGQVADLASLQSAARKVLWCPPSSSQQQQDNGTNNDENSLVFMDSASGNELYLIDASRMKSKNNDNDNNNDSSSNHSMVGGTSLLERRTVVDHSDVRHIIIGHGDSSLTLANAAALSRYGGGGAHLLDENDSSSSRAINMLAHAPAIALSQKLLSATTANQGSWAHRVLFHNDNKDPSSWCCSVAIEMGLKTFQKRLSSFHDQGGDNAVDYDDIEWVICGQFNGSTYHHHRELDDGDDADDESSTVQGLFLETPTISFQNGRALSIHFPNGYDPSQGTTGIEFDSVSQVMDVEARILSRKLFSQYKELIEMQWLVYEHSHGFQSKIGTVVLEPVVLMNRYSSTGSRNSSNGTLELVDPLWQRALMDIAKSRNVPVVWNETSLTSAAAVDDDLCQVMGLSSSCKILKSNPDIACYTLQHLVGGIVDPIHVTLASKEVFETLVNDEEEDNDRDCSIPHPVRCVNALYALEAQEAMMSLVKTDENNNNNNNKISSSGLPRMIFDEHQIRQLSELPFVERSFAFGTLCAVTITARPDDESVDEMQKDDYYDTNDEASLSLTVSIVQNIRQQGIPARSLGNTVYMVASPTTDRQEGTRLLQVLHQTIERHGHAV